MPLRKRELGRGEFPFDSLLDDPLPFFEVKFELNGEPCEAEHELTVRALLERFDLHRRRVAVALNSKVVPRNRFDETRVREGDRVEVIQAVGGG
jgi:sulfur carrier protein